ncbi:MAG: malonyl-CoA O-methyltransferase [Glaciecola sp.]|jgi:malonyl-CoA O-methyltransferase
MIQCLDKKSIAEHFSNAANNYDRYANVQKQIAELNIELLLKIAKQPAAISLDLGCGTGIHTKHIAALSNQCVAIDISHGMLKTAEKNTASSTTNADGFVRTKNNIQFCRGDADALPMLSASVDIFHSSMALQWSSSPAICLSEVSRVLAHNGTAQLAIMLDSSMHELRDAWQSIGVESRVNRFFSQTQWMDAMHSLSADNRHMRVEFEYQTQRFQEWHAGSLQMLRALKKVGAATKQVNHVIGTIKPISLSSSSATSTISRQELTQVDKQMTKQESVYPLSYDVLFLSIKRTKI